MNLSESEFSQILKEMIPTWDKDTIYFVVPDAIFEKAKALKNDGISVDVRQLENWDAIVNSSEDEFIIEWMYGKNLERLPKGRLLIVTEACTRYDVPSFDVQEGSFREFVESHHWEDVFNGDTIILAPDDGRISMFHHEGGDIEIHLR